MYQLSLRIGKISIFDRNPGECFGLEFNPRKSKLFRAIPNQSEKRFVSHVIKND